MYYSSSLKKKNHLNPDGGCIVTLMWSDRTLPLRFVASLNGIHTQIKARSKAY